MRTGSLVKLAASSGIAAPMSPSANLLTMAADQILLKVAPRLLLAVIAELTWQVYLVKRKGPDLATGA